MFIDTHCHLDAYEEFSKESLDALFERLRSNTAKLSAGPTANGEASWNSPKNAKEDFVQMPEAFIHVACSPESFDRGVELSEKYPFVFTAYGIHPECVLRETPSDEERLLELLKHPKAIACGEFGLDYHYGKDTRKQQLNLFQRHLQLGIQSGKPLVLHLREADDDALAILRSVNLQGKNIHVHCFTVDPEFVEELLSLDANVFIGFTGIVTFKSAQNVRDAASLVPYERILLETDTPYMAPVPFRGKTCHPGFIPYTAQMLATLKKMDLEELYRQCRKNTRICYGI